METYKNCLHCMQVWLHPHIFHHKMSDGMLSAFLAECGTSSLVPRPLPDFILQPWRKFCRRPGTITMSQTSYNDGNMSTQYVVSTVTCTVLSGSGSVARSFDHSSISLMETLSHSTNHGFYTCTKVREGFLEIKICQVP